MSTEVSLELEQPKALRLQGGRSGIVLFHGLSSAPLEIQFLARGLQRAGYTVHVPVIDGYTFGWGNDSDRNVHAWLARAQAEVDQMLERCDQVAVGGLCVGANLALNVAARRAGKISAVLGLSPCLHYDGWGNPWHTPLLPLARVVPFAGRIKVPERHPFGLKDERMRAWIARQMKQMGRSEAGEASLRVADLLRARALATLARKALPRLDMPMLLVHAKEDECATPRSSLDIAMAVQTTQVRMVLLANSYHMISIDREKDLVLQEMLQFMQQHVQRHAPTADTRSGQVVSLFGAP